MEAIRFTKDEDFNNFIRPIEDIEAEIKPERPLENVPLEELVKEIEYRIRTNNAECGV